ncbi:MAG: hypothetical protein ACFBRM_09235 [Pikeienuella sp.]
MTASLVPLFQARRGWTNDERAQFARIERMLQDAGFGIEVEHGVTEEGEPWCVFCAASTGDVIIHVACIDGRFMFDSTALPRPIEGASFQRCAERFFDDLALPAPLNQRRGQVYLHPSALLASLFITVLLYAQATTEQPLFVDEAVDVDDPDAPGAQPHPLALRIKSLAQQVADFFTGNETSAQGQQGYVNPAMAAIPAGMALAAIAIAQDLANAAESGALGGDDTVLALLTGSEVASGEAPSGAVDPAPAVEEAADESGRVRGETVTAEAEPEDGIDAVRTAAKDPAAQVEDLLAEVADLVSGGFSSAASALDVVAGLEVAALLGATLFDGGAEEMAGQPESRSAFIDDPFTNLFVAYLFTPAVTMADSIEFDIDGRSIGLEIVVVAGGAFERVTDVILSQITDDGGGDAMAADAGDLASPDLAAVTDADAAMLLGGADGGTTVDWETTAADVAAALRDTLAELADETALADADPDAAGNVTVADTQQGLELDAAASSGATGRSEPPALADAVGAGFGNRDSSGPVERGLAPLMSAAAQPAAPVDPMAGAEAGDGQGFGSPGVGLPGRRVVSIEEAKELTYAFMASVGDTNVLARDGADLPETDDIDLLLETLFTAGRDTTFFDGTLYTRGSVDFGSHNLHAEYLYLEDDTKLTFYAFAPEFDGWS